MSDDNVSAPGAPYNKNHANVPDEEDQASLSSDATQAGVKNIEAVSQTWTQSSLVAAYFG